MAPSLAWVFSRSSRATRVPPANCRKWDLIHALAEIHGYQTLLEMSTAGTGGSYPFIERSRFTTCLRLSYLTPEGWSDGAPVDYRTTSRDTAEYVRRIRAEHGQFDIVFLDAWHEYETARRDLSDALTLVNRNGVVVVHDCLPVRPELCTPTRGELVSWFGVSYKLYVDVLTSRSDLWHCTVDTDCGCAILRRRRLSALYRRGVDVAPAVLQAWRACGGDYARSYQLFDAHRAALMNVVSVADFIEAETAARGIGRLLFRWQRPAGRDSLAPR